MGDLRLYNLSDNGNGDLHGDEITYDAYWAASPQDAEAAFRERYERETGVGPDEYTVRCQDATEGQPEKLASLVLAYAPDAPKQENRAEVLRLIGWSQEDDRQCDSCGLHDMGDERFAVCHECDCCIECGHDDNCPERKS